MHNTSASSENKLLGKLATACLPLLIVLALFTLSTASDPLPVFRLAVSQSGVYQVSYATLVEAGLPAQPVPSRDVSLTNQGKSVPIWVADGGDGEFGPGDWFEFIGEHLAGDDRYFHPYAQHNIYWLEWDAEAAARMQTVPAQELLQKPSRASGDPGARGRETGVYGRVHEDFEAPSNAGIPSAVGFSTAPQTTAVSQARPATAQLSRHQHLEHDQLLIRLAGRETGPIEQPEQWFWAKLTHIDPQPFFVQLDLADLDSRADESVQLRLHFRALSKSTQQDIPDHRVEVALNGVPIGAGEWDDKSPYTLSLPPLEAQTFAVGPNTLSLRVPARTPEGHAHPVVDVLMLDWIELSYPHRRVMSAPQVQLSLTMAAPAEQVQQVQLTGLASQQLLAYGPHSRIAVTPDRHGEFAGLHQHFPSVDGPGIYHLVRDQQFRLPDRIERDEPSVLRATAQQADYLMITHASLGEATEPLAAFHRQRGLQVAVIDVQDIYDEFNYGIVHPQAIRDAIAYAYHHWARPAPRFVLLVGDASWDTKNATVDDANYANWTQRQLLNSSRFVVKQSTAYQHGPDHMQRNLIPVWNYHSKHGHSASDNWYVSVDGDDLLPDLAIGRLAVAEPAEVQAIVTKTIRHIEQGTVDSRPRQTVWIASEDAMFQHSSRQVARFASQQGFAPLTIYPRPDEASNVAHQSRLRRAWDDGPLLVHFYGHGGRYIWRTGPPDLRKNHDLFTLDDLDQLTPTDRLPVVLSLTCFSAPFDHPNADSIGEKFVRLPDRGAVAVLAASWRVDPSPTFSQKLVQAMLQPGTVGEAIMRAKQAMSDETQVALYNLLGDPAVPLAVPQHRVELAARWQEPHGWAVTATVKVSGFQGQARIDWLDADGAVVSRQTHEMSGPRLTVTYTDQPERLAKIQAVRVYAWDAKRNRDALGLIHLNRTTRY